MADKAAVDALCDDLLAENRELDEFVSALGADGWSRKTDFFDWTVRDEILHLHQVDRFGIVSLNGRELFTDMVPKIRALQAEGVELSEQVRREFAGHDNRDVLQAWRKGYEEIVSRLRAAEDGYRIAWFGPDMGILSFATARLMEVWAHGQDIYDLFDIRRKPTDRIRHICDIGARTFNWSFRNRGLDIPPRPDIHLTGPSGASWDWPGDGNGTVSGPALDFAMVVTQRRACEDTALAAEGDAATQWLKIAQCFAGAPQERAAPGSRPPL